MLSEVKATTKSMELLNRALGAILLSNIYVPFPASSISPPTPFHSQSVMLIDIAVLGQLNVPFFIYPPSSNFSLCLFTA